MMRWLWKLQSDRGGQHAEAGVLMATLIVLAGAVIVGSVPQLSTAVADQWVCNISDSGSERCAGETASTIPDPARTAKAAATAPAAGTAVQSVAATSAGDPARSHFPKRSDNSGEGGTWTLPNGRDMTMDSCKSAGTINGTINCIGGFGGYYECSIDPDFDPSTGITVTSSCSRTITPKTPLTCSDEGLSPGWDTCTGPNGVILHCTDADAAGNRNCSDAAHDADAEPLVLTSCGEQTGSGPVSSFVCMGANGTLYEGECRGTDDATRVCGKGDRSISPSSPTLTECRNDPGEANGAVVQCTYTPVSCDPAWEDPSSCTQAAVTVRCLVVGATYEQCQSLGLLVPPGGSLETVCLDRVDKVFCKNPDSYVRMQPVADADSVTTDVGGVDITIDPDETFDVPTTEGTETLDIEELTELCTTEPTTCDDMIDSTVGTGVMEAETMLRDQGLCTDDCDQVLDRFAESLDGVATSDGLSMFLDYSSTILGTLAIAAIVGPRGDTQVAGTLTAAGTLAILGKLHHQFPAAAPAAKAAIIAAGSRILGVLGAGLTALADLWEAQAVANPGMTPAQQMAAANRVFDELAEAMEEGRAGGTA